MVVCGIKEWGVWGGCINGVMVGGGWWVIVDWGWCIGGIVMVGWVVLRMVVVKKVLVVVEWM